MWAPKYSLFCPSNWTEATLEDFSTVGNIWAAHLLCHSLNVAGWKEPDIGPSLASTDLTGPDSGNDIKENLHVAMCLSAHLPFFLCREIHHRDCPPLCRNRKKKEKGQLPCVRPAQLYFITWLGFLEKVASIGKIHFQAKLEISSKSLVSMLIFHLFRCKVNRISNRCASKSSNVGYWF